MTQLGHLLWWKVGAVDLTHADLAEALKDTGVEAPKRPIPVDVFRKMTSTAKAVYTLDEGLDLECTIAKVDSGNDKMLVHHLVGTLKRGQVTEKVRKIGEIVFYKPPKGQHSKARLRVVPQPPGRWEKEVAAFVTSLRQQYSEGIKGALDGQAIRRLVRAHLAKTGVVYVDGPYFFESRDQVAELEPLFAALGDNSFIMDIPILDNERNRAFLARTNYNTEEDES